MKQNIIKAGMLIFLITYLVLVYNRDNVKDVPMEKIVTVMQKDDTVTALKKGDANALKRYYGLPEADFDGVLLYYAESTMAVEELFIAKAADAAGADALEAVAQSRLDKQKKSFEGYGVDQSALLEEAVLEKKGKFVIYAAGKDAEKWKEEFLNCIR